MSDHPYHGAHRPAEEGPALWEMDKIFGDIYEHPEYYVFGDDHSRNAKAIRVLQLARGNPDMDVSIFRAAPPGVDTINTGDWVCTTLEYAREHAMQSDDPDEDWPVYAAVVKASTIHTGGSDLLEWGYFGPTVRCIEYPPPE